MRLLNFFRKNKEKEAKNGRFADFFLHASPQEKERVFREAARRANEDQRSLAESLNRSR